MAAIPHGEIAPNVAFSEHFATVVFANLVHVYAKAIQQPIAGMQVLVERIQRGHVNVTEKTHFRHWTQVNHGILLMRNGGINFCGRVIHVHFAQAIAGERMRHAAHRHFVRKRIPVQIAARPLPAHFWIRHAQKRFQHGSRH